MLILVMIIFFMGRQSTFGTLVIILGVVAVAIGFWRLSSYLRYVPATISIDSERFSVVVRSLTGHRETTSLRLGQIRELSIKGHGARLKSLQLDTTGGETKIFKEIDAGTAQEVERLYSIYGGKTIRDRTKMAQLDSPPPNNPKA